MRNLQQHDPLSATLLCSGLAANDFGIRSEEASKILHDIAPEVIEYLNYDHLNELSLQNNFPESVPLPLLGQTVGIQHSGTGEIIDALISFLKNRDQKSKPLSYTDLGRYYNEELKSIQFKNVHAVDMGRPIEIEDYRELFSNSHKEPTIRPEFQNNDEVPNILFSVIRDVTELRPLEAASEEARRRACEDIKSLIEKGKIAPDTLNAENWAFAPGKGESGQLFLMNWRSCREIDHSRDNVQEYKEDVKKVLMLAGASEDY